MPTLREQLDIIDGWLCDTDTGDPVALVAILSALRGPDSPNDELKQRTTAGIRSAAFPRLAARYLLNPFHSFWAMQCGVPTIRTHPADKSDHFTVHIQDAARVLGLKML